MESAGKNRNAERKAGRPGRAAQVTASPSDRELIITRVINAPRQLVFQAWTDHEHVKRWWWPQGSTLVSLEMDVRPGGIWRRCIRSLDGVDRWPHGVYKEIVEPERLAFTYMFDDPRGGPGYETLVTVEFADLGARTKMTFRQAVFESVEARDAHRGGWTGTLERFAVYVTDEPALTELRNVRPASGYEDVGAQDGRAVVMTRDYAAPRERVFEAWTDPAQLMKWWGPDGFTTTSHAMDVRPGGAWVYTMHGPDGTDYKDRQDYLEVVRPELLVYELGSRADDGSVPFHVTVTFAAHNGGTRLIMRLLFSSIAERRKTADFAAIEGGKQTLARLAAHLALSRQVI